MFRGSSSEQNFFGTNREKWVKRTPASKEISLIFAPAHREQLLITVGWSAYPTAAYLAFLTYLAIYKINNLRVLNTGAGVRLPPRGTIKLPGFMRLFERSFLRVPYTCPRFSDLGFDQGLALRHEPSVVFFCDSWFPMPH